MRKFLLLTVLTIGLCHLGFGQGTCSNFVATSCPAAVPSGVTHFYFVDYVGGSDSNSGASESTPFQHAPGCANATSTAAAKYTSASGTGWIFKGGVTIDYHCYPASIPYGGTNSNPTYMGSDPGWYTGGAWARPIVDGGGSSGYDSNAKALWTDVANNTNYFTIDNIEFTGLYWSSTCGPNTQSACGYVASHNFTGSTNWEAKNLYVHGWSHSSGSFYDPGNYTPLIGLPITTTAGSQSSFHDSVIDGSDTTKDCCGGSAAAIQYNNYEAYLDNMFFQQAQNNQFTIFHDNYIAHQTGTGGNNGVHSNCFHSFAMNGTATGGTLLVYNNLIDCKDAGTQAEGALFENNGTTNYIFNNIITLGQPSGLTTSSFGTGGAANTFFAFNNTICTYDCSTSAPASQCYNLGYNSIGTFANNFCVTNNNDSTSFGTYSFTGSDSFPSPTFTISCSGGSGNPQTNFGATQICAPIGTGNGTGHLNSAQTCTSGGLCPFDPQDSTAAATVAVGASNSSYCTAISSLNSAAGTACLSDTSAGVYYNTSNHTVTYPNRTPVTRSSWYNGAYEYSSSSTYTITLSSIVGHGTVTSSDSVISCTTGTTGTCADSTATGTVTLTESPSAGWTFSSWGGGTCSGSASTCNVTTTATVTATFTQLTATAPTCTANCAGTYSVSVVVSLANSNSGTTIMCYTTSGTTPVSNSLGTGCTTGIPLTGATNTVTINATSTLKVIAGVNGEIDSSVLSEAYTITGGAPGTLNALGRGATCGPGCFITGIGSGLVAGTAQLPTTWVNNLEYVGTTTNAITYPSSGSGGSWTCGATGYGPYTAGSQTGLTQAVNDAESCRTANGSGTTITIPAGALFSSALGLILPQTAGDTSTNFIVLTSSTPLTAGQTVCSHGVQDNVAASTQPGVRNLGCNATSMSYQVGTTVTAVSGPFTLANGTNTNTSAYNDIASMYTIEYTSTTALSTAGVDVNGVAPHHFAILNGEFRPQAGLAAAGNIVQFGTGTETLTSQLPQHIHFAYNYVHGDWADAPVSGGVATAGPTGANSISGAIVTGCIQCSVMYTYGDKALRPNTEGHFIFTNYGSQMKFAHNWLEGQSINNFSGGYAAAITIPSYFPAQDVEDRANRYTYPYSWMLAAGAPIIRGINEHGTGTGSGYLVNDVITVVQTGGSGGTGTITSVGGGGTITGVSVTSAGTGYAVANNLSVTGGSGTSGTVDIVTGYFPNNGTTQGFARKNCHENKVGARVLIDGNICENVDFTGAQGILLSAKSDNISTGLAGASGNYGFQTVDFTITHNVFRNSCNGSHIMAPSGSTSGNGGGITYHPQRFDVEQNLAYGISVSNPGCGSILQSGPQKGWTLAALYYTWTGVTITENSAGTVATATMTAAPGYYESDIVPGDLVQISACTGTPAFNTSPTAPGLVAIAGTVPTGLTVVMANAGQGVTGSATDNTCTLTSGQGYPANLTFNHNTEIIAGIQATSVAASPYMTLVSTTPYALSANISFTNSIFVGGGFYSSSVGEGTILETQSFSSNLNLSNSAFPTRDQYVSCSGHSPGVGGAAACYGTPPAVLYFPYNSCSTGNDPTLTGTSASIGMIGAMSISGCLAGTQTTFPYILNDWHQYRLCKSSDASCNSKASLYASGQTFQASDGTDLGVITSTLDTAQTSNKYVCSSPCGTGPYADH